MGDPSPAEGWPEDPEKNVTSNAGAVFEAEWLRLREPVDHAARDVDLTRRLAHEGAARGWTRVLDLGGGTGSNVRYLHSWLPWARSWTVVDHDATLLKRLAAPTASPVRAVHGDLAQEGLEAVKHADVVTASALLDLVSEHWLQDLVERSVTRDRGLLFTLTYDGSVEWRGAEVDSIDELVLRAVNRHQGGDKGLGAALGPRATDVARNLLSAAGYRTWVRPSPWVLRGAQAAPLVQELVDGWVRAAVQIRPADAPRIRAWGGRRVKAFEREIVTLRVGHQDVLALPPDASR